MPQKHPHHPHHPRVVKKNHGHQMIMKISALRVIGTSRRPAADRLQDTRRIAHKENGEPYQPYAESNAGTAGGAGSLRQANGGFSNRPTDVEAAYEESASRAAADGELDRRRCAQCRGSPDGKERQYQQRGAFVWLHPECRRYWLKKHPQ